MGLVPGSMVRVVRYAPFGDPMQVHVYGYHLSLRKSEAAKIEVERVDALEAACGSV
jgi:Fe2+ transport system protein FeoA